jgi:ribosomal protein S18 acetylase RimI-like enzyme
MARIREITEKDIPSVVEILAQSEPWISRGATGESLARALGDTIGRGHTFVAEEDLLPAALACFVPEPVIAGGGCLRFIAVRQDKRRRGIGRQLMGFVERKVFSKSQNLYVSISSTNDAAQRFFERLGYRRVGEIPGLYGADETEYILRKAWQNRSQTAVT